MHSRFKNSLPDLYENGVYMRVLHTNMRPVLVSVSSQGTTRRPKLLVDAYPPVKRNTEVASLRHVLRSMFGPTFDFDHFYTIAKKDAIMRTIAKKLRGLRPIRPPTIFESIVIAITEQQISLASKAPRKGIEYAEGFRQHNYIGFSVEDGDPLSHTLGDKVLRNH